MAVIAILFLQVEQVQSVLADIIGDRYGTLRIYKR